MSTTSPASPEAIRTLERPRAAESAPGLGLLFALGAVVGSFFDGFHTYSGTTAYPSPVALRMAWWTPPLFGAAFVLLGVGYALGRRPEVARPDAWRLAVGFVVFGALYFASGFLPASNAAKLAVLLVGAALLFAMCDASRAALVSGLASAILGPAFEVLLVRTGCFAHLQPDFLGIPMWLPALYLASGPGLAPLAHAILRLGRSDPAR